MEVAGAAAEAEGSAEVAVPAVRRRSSPCSGTRYTANWMTGRCTTLCSLQMLHHPRRRRGSNGKQEVASVALEGLAVVAEVATAMVDEEVLVVLEQGGKLAMAVAA